MYLLCQPSTIYLDVEFTKYESKDPIRNLKDAHSNGLTDALMADVPDSGCTLIITEGTSAKEFALKGLSVLGNEKYGVYAIEGVLQNIIRTPNKISAEVQDIFSALGLELRNVPRRHFRKDFGPGYICKDIKTLRYRHVMIMTDQDVDGAHIKGLLINMFYCLCPTLLKVPLFLQDFTTDIVRATHIQTGQIKGFKLLSDYTAWQSKVIPAEWTIEYFKGLGTSIRLAIEYFKNKEEHTRCFIWNDIDANYLDKVFNPKRADERKIWICQHQITTVSPYSSRVVTYGEFIKKELMLYAFEDIRRKLPSVVDGLKVSQRKVVHYMLDMPKDGLKSARHKISQLVGAISQHSNYRHAEENFEGVIKAMAAAGKNNIDLLEPHEGSRKISSKYITMSPVMTHIAQFIFRKEDIHLLDYISDGGTLVEPECYVPVVPLALINSCEGFAIGFSAMLPNYHPKDVIDNVRRLLDGEETVKMVPWYKNLTVTEEKGRYYAEASWSVQHQKVVTINYLLPGVHYQDYANFLTTLKKEKKKNIEDFNLKLGTANEVVFQVTLQQTMHDKDIIKLLYLKRHVSTSKTYLLNAKGNVANYATTKEVMRQFYDKRLALYKRRKEMQDLQSQLEGLKECEGLDVEKKRSDLLEAIRQKAINLWKKDLDDLEKELQVLYKSHWKR